METSQDEGWWLGFFAATIRHAIRESPTAARERLRDALQRFTESDVCEPELRTHLNAKPRPPAERLNDGYDLADDYKPCGNPECRAPIPKRSRKLYCDSLCRNTAEEFARHSRITERMSLFRETHPEYDSIPF